MELLNPTLRDLEKAEKTLGSLENHYIRTVYPQFKEDFKNLGIADIDNYANYNLQNILDDLKHLQCLLDGSPSKKQFHKKIDFLVQLSDGALKRALKIPIIKKKALRETADSSNKDNDSQKNKDKTVRTLFAESPAEVIPVPKLGLIKSKAGSPKKLKEASPKKTKENNVVIPKEDNKKEHKKKPVVKEEKLLTRISEEKITEECSEIGSPTVPSTQGVHHPEVSEFDWKLTEEQQNTINSTLKKYDMSESIWQNYIMTRVHGDAQMRRMGFDTTVNKKVDYAMETRKFVEELERHMSRKTRSIKKSNAINLKPIQSDPVKPFSTVEEMDSLTLSLTNFGFKSATHKANTLPSIDLTNTNQDQFFDKEKPHRMLRKYHTASLAKLPDIDTSYDKNKFIDLKSYPLSTSHITSYNILNKFSPIPTLEKSFNPLELHDSLQDSLRGSMMEKEPSLNFVKSQGKYKLPSISSSDSYIEKLSQIDGANSLISPKNFAGRRYKKASEEETHQLKSALSTSKLHDSIDDSLRAYTINNNGAKIYDIVNNIGSNDGTIDSKYLKSLEEIPGSGCETKDDTGNNGRSKGEYIRTHSRQNDSLMSESESLNERSSLQNSARTLVTVCSNDNDSRLALSRNFMIQSNRFGGMVEKEYIGDVRRLCLLGSGSEAKVFLCRAKGIEGEVALKQYDLVQNQKKNSEAYTNLKNEFEMLKSLDHENITKYICLYKPNKSKYNNCIEFGIIMEYMKGGSLESLIEEGAHNISSIEKKRIIKQILSGISFLHQHNIIHRDLKPGNILLSEDKSQVKLGDFGISKKTEHDTHTKRTLVGTPWYMAPEVISQEGYSSKADIWSLGCCIFHLITGHKPYNNANAIQALLLMVNYQSPLDNCSPDAAAKVDELEGMRDFLNGCFCRNQNDRPSADILLNHPIFDELR